MMADDNKQKQDPQALDTTKFEQPLYQGTLEQEKAATSSATDPKQAEAGEEAARSVVRPRKDKDTANSAHLTRFQASTDLQATPPQDDAGKLRPYPRAAFAGFWVRALAFIVDLVIVGALSRILLGILTAFVPSLAESDAGMAIFKYIVAILYFTLVTYLSAGYTVGKALFHLRTVMLNGEPLSLLTCFAREGIGKMILMKVKILGLVVLFTAHHENFMDFFTETSVLNERVLATAEQLQQSGYAKEMEES